MIVSVGSAIIAMPGLHETFSVQHAEKPLGFRCLHCAFRTKLKITFLRVACVSGMRTDKPYEQQTQNKKNEIQPETTSDCLSCRLVARTNLQGSPVPRCSQLSRACILRSATRPFAAACVTLLQSLIACGGIRQVAACSSALVRCMSIPGKVR